MRVLRACALLLFLGGCGHRAPAHAAPCKSALVPGFEAMNPHDPVGAGADAVILTASLLSGKLSGCAEDPHAGILPMPERIDDDMGKIPGLDR